MREMFIRGLVGMSASGASVGISLSQVEAWMRVTGSGLGIIICVMTIIGMIRSWNKKKE